MKIAIVHTPYIEPEGAASGAVSPNESAEARFAGAKARAQANIDLTFKLLREAGEAGADIAVTNEDFGAICAFMHDIKHPNFFGRLVKELEGPVIDGLRAVASEYRMYVAANEFESDGDNIYNTSKLIGRDGAVVGKYRKVHLPSGERFKVQPGGEYPVFKTDLGNIGFAICYDLLFPEHCRILALNGADAVIHQSQGWFPGGANKNVLGEYYLRVRATENRVYMIVAKNEQNDGGMSCVVDNRGNMLASRAGMNPGLLLTDVEPDYEAVDLYDYDNYFAGLKSLRSRHLLHRSPSAYGRLLEGAPVFTSELLSAERMCTAEEWEERIKALEEMPESELNKMHW